MRDVLTIKELINLAHPNQVEMQQIFVNKQITSQQVIHVPTQTTLSQINQTFNANQQLTQYQYTTATGGTPFTETYAMTYAGNNKLNSVTYGSNNQVLTYGYTQTGKLSTLQVSGVGTYTYGYNPTDGSISTLTYPNQSQETYSYNGGGADKILDTNIALKERLKCFQINRKKKP